MKQLITAGLVVIKNRKLLLAFSKNKKAWYLPGGKINNNETTRDTLMREIKEELNISLRAEEVRFYTHISAPAYGETNLMMEQDCFMYELQGNPVAGAEIGGLQFFDSKMYSTEKQVPGVIALMQMLIKENLID